MITERELKAMEQRARKVFDNESLIDPTANDVMNLIDEIRSIKRLLKEVIRRMSDIV